MLTAQPINTKDLKGLKIRNIGPAGMSGRVTSVDVDLTNDAIIYAGTASGGVWKSVDGGVDWKPIFDEQPLQSIGAVTVDQHNPSIIWVGTGEGNPRNSHNTGKGIYKSLDGGKSWTLMGLEKTRLIHRIIVDPNNSEVLYVATLGSAWGKNPERGVYKTTDGGDSWTKILYINDSTGCADLIIDPSNPNKLIAAMWEYGRQPWFFNSGGKGSGLYVTFDGGKSWKQRTKEDGLPDGELGRIGLAIAPSKPSVIYALVEAKKNALYKSVDGGFKWKKVSKEGTNIGNRPFYYADIFVDPKNENRIYSLYSMISRSEDGGKTFDIIVPYSGVHPDHHAFWIHPDKPNFIIDGNDGGLNISYDGGDNWRFVEKLPLAQFYHINYDMDVPYNVYGGMQDNGSWIGPSMVWKRGGIRNTDWQEVLFGDGFDVMPRKDDNRYGYAMYQGGNLHYYDKVTGADQAIKPIHPDNETLRFSWNAALAQNPFHDCGIYFGSQFLHKSLDCGQTWEIISPDLTTNDTTKQKQALSGGLTIDATRAENFTTILCIAPSPANENTIWVGTDDGNVQLTTDGGDNWRNLSNKLVGCPKGSWIPQIEVSEGNENVAYVVVNNYRRNDWKPYVYKTSNKGKSFTRIVDENKVQGYARCIVQDPIEENLLFLGTDYGLYATFDGGTNWDKWNNDFPSVNTSDLKIHPRQHDLIVGTFGRAAWILDDITPLRTIAATNGNVLKENLYVFNTPDAYQVNYRSFDGVRFGADATYSGANKSRAAMITIWLGDKSGGTTTNKDETKDKPKKKQKQTKTTDHTKDKTPNKDEIKDPKGKIKVTVFNIEGDTVRNFTAKIDTGMNRIYWGLNQNGIHYPAWNDKKADADPPGGQWVLPGQYTLILQYGKYQDTTQIKVNADPRQKAPSAKAIEQREAYQTQYNAIVNKATQGFDRLKEAQKTIALVDKQLINVADSTKQAIAKEGKALNDSILQIMHIYRLPQNTKGYNSVTPTLVGKLWNMSSYLYTIDNNPNPNAELALKQGEQEVQETIDRINIFFDTHWTGYQKKVEAIPYSLFKTYEPIK